MSNGLSASDFTPVQASDFKPVSAPPDAGPSASDFKPVQASDFKPAITNQPGGALPFDDIITREAQAAGIPTQLALSIGRTESGGTQDRARVRSSAGAVGVMQLMPDTAAGLGVKNIEDPSDNIRGGVRYLKQLSDKYHGDTRAIAAAYNMGPGAYDEYLAGKRAMPEETANYINKVANMPPDAPQAHKDAGPAVMLHIKRVADTFVRAQKAGKDPFKAIGRTPEMRGTAQIEHNGQASLKWLQDHPVEGLADILGGLQRGVGQVEYNDLQHRGTDKAFTDMFDGVWDAVINPTDKNITRTTRSTLDELSADTHGRVKFPTHAEIDDAIHNNVWVPQSLRGTVSTLAKAGEDMGAQFVSDPMSLPGGLLEHGFNAAGGVARAIHSLMPVQAALNWTHLPQMASTLERVGSMAFGVRRDLDAAGFTREGKQARVAMENAELTRHGHNVEQNHAVGSDPQAAGEQYVNYIAEHGRGHTAVTARQSPLHTGNHVNAPTGYAGPQPDFHLDVAELTDPLTAPARRTEILNNVAQSIFRNQLNSRSTQFFGANPHLFRGSAGQLQNIGTEEASVIQKFLDNSPLEPLREIGKKAITWNPLPHGMKNVGTLTYLAGGLPAVARGLAAMTHPPSPAEIKALEDMGALPKYLGRSTGIEAKSQAILERMELGWRHGLAQTLERQLGTPVTEEEKLLRGWLINNKVGDYRNQSAFVKMFQALGGPFVAFRLGIVPARVAETIAAHPGRVSAIAHGQQNVQRNRSKQAQRQNTIEPGGPVHDFASMWSNPGQYLANTIGSLGSLGQSTAAGAHGLLETASSLASSYLPGPSAAQELAKTATGHERPGQKVQLADQLMDVLAQSFGVYYHKNPSPKQEAQEYKKIRKGAI